MVELALLVGFIIGLVMGAVLGAAKVVRDYVADNPPPAECWNRTLPPSMPPPPMFPPLAVPSVSASNEVWSRYFDEFTKLNESHAKRSEAWDGAMREATRQLKEWGDDHGKA